MTADATLPRMVFVGGPGRSGTSFVADRLGRHPAIAAFQDVELKFFCEAGGLMDLGEALAGRYSPNRAAVAMAAFERLTGALIDGRYGQRPLGEVAAGDRLTAAVAAFRNALAPAGHPMPTEPARFLAEARRLVAAVAAEAARPGTSVFLEKTPHNLLFADFLADLAPGAALVHVMRDPRAIAFSLLSMPWGPDHLAAAADWVAGYCESWQAACRHFEACGLAILSLHIETIAAEPRVHAERVVSHLGLDPAPAIFDGADPPTLSRWLVRASAADRDLLDQHLGAWANQFGYAAEPGVRAAGARPRPDPGSDGAPVVTATT